MRQQEQAAEALRSQPIWVQDLLAWLEKIQQQDLTVDEWVRQVQDVLAELPGQGQTWPKRQADGGIEVVQVEKEAELQPLNDEDRVRIWEELHKANSVADEKVRSSDLAAVVAQIPASEPQLLQAAFEAAKSIEHEEFRSPALVAVAAQIPASEPELLKEALEAANSIEPNILGWTVLTTVAAQIPASESELLQVTLEAAKYSRFRLVF